MIKAGKAAFGPRIVPTKNLVNGNNNKIKIMNGMARNTFTKVAVMKLRNLFSHRPSLSVKYKNNPKASPNINVPMSAMMVIYNVSYVASSSASPSNKEKSNVIAYNLQTNISLFYVMLNLFNFSSFTNQLNGNSAHCSIYSIRTFSLYD